MKRLALFLFIIISMYYQYDSNLCFATTEDEKLSQLERIMLSKTYTNENYIDRLNRLENKIFGAQQRGSIEQRISKLLETNSYSCYEEPTEYSAIVSSNKGLKGFWNKIKSEYTNGVVTGYTPTMYDSYDFGNTYPFNKYNSTFPQYKFNMNDYNNFYTPINNNQNAFMPNFNRLSNFKHRHNNYYDRNYTRKYLPNLINTSTLGGTKVTLIND